MNKKAGVLRYVLIVIVLILIFIMLLRYVKAADVIVNGTIKVNSTDIILNVSNTVYNYSNTNFTNSFQQIFSVSFENFSANISSVVCSNSTVQLSCLCPVNVHPVNCTVPDSFDLNPSTKTLLFETYKNELTNKISESSNKVAQDVIFQLLPSKVEIQECRDKAYNATNLQLEAERQRDQQYSENQKLAVVVTSYQRQIRWLEVIGLSFVFVGLVLFAWLTGIHEKIGALGGGGSL